MYVRRRGKTGLKGEVGLLARGLEDLRRAVNEAFRLNSLVEEQPAAVLPRSADFRTSYLNNAAKAIMERIQERPLCEHIDISIRSMIYIYLPGQCDPTEEIVALDLNRLDFVSYGTLKASTPLRKVAESHQKIRVYFSALSSHIGEFKKDFFDERHVDFHNLVKAFIKHHGDKASLPIFKRKLEDLRVEILAIVEDLDNGSNLRRTLVKWERDIEFTKGDLAGQISYRDKELESDRNGVSFLIKILRDINKLVEKFLTVYSEIDGHQDIKSLDKLLERGQAVINVLDEIFEYTPGSVDAVDVLMRKKINSILNRSNIPQWRAEFAKHFNDAAEEIWLKKIENGATFPQCLTDGMHLADGLARVASLLHPLLKELENGYKIISKDGGGAHG